MSRLLSRISRFSSCLYQPYRYEILGNHHLHSKSASDTNSKSEKLSRYFGHEEVTPNEKRKKGSLMLVRW